MSDTNGTASKPDTRQVLRETRSKIRLLKAENELALLEKRTKRLREGALLFDWVSGYTDLIDRMSTGDGRMLLATSVAADRLYGANWPFWRTWQEHSLLRGASRMLCTTSTCAQAILSGLTSYVIGKGYDWKVRLRDEDRELPGMMDAVQDTVDEFRAINEWSELEQEIFKRTRRDGEAFPRWFPQDDGTTTVRIVDASQVLPDPELPLSIGSFGIVNPLGDIETHKAFSVTYSGNTADIEEVESSTMMMLKVNVDRQVKRGLTDFTYDTYDRLKGVSRLIENLSDGSAIQAAITLIRQHETALPTQVQGFADSQADFTEVNPWTGASVNNRSLQSGSVVDIPKGMNYVDTPYSQGAASHLQVATLVMQTIAARWNAPAWLVSGDAAASSYASALTEESPFVKKCTTEQDWYGNKFKRIIISAIKHKCDCGLMRARGRTFTWQEVMEYVDLGFTPPTIETRNRLEEAQTDALLIQTGISSRQIAAGARNLNWDHVVADNEEYQQRMGGQGLNLPIPGEEQPGSPGPQPGGAGDSLAGIGRKAGPPEGAPEERELREESGELSRYSCPHCKGTNAFNGDPKSGLQFRGGGLCQDCGKSFSIVGMKLKPISEDESPDIDEQAPLIAEMLYHLFGEDAINHLQDVSESWSEKDHPRGKGGRFIPRGSAEAVATAKTAVDKVLKGKGGDANEVANHLAILTVKQLRELHQANGVKKIPSGILREHLVQAVKDKLTPASKEPEPAKPVATAGKEKKPVDAASQGTLGAEKKDPVKAVANAVSDTAKEGGLASMVDVRKHLDSNGIKDRKEQDDAIQAARKAGTVTGSRHEGRHGITDAERWALLRDPTGGDDHIGHLALKPQGSASEPATEPKEKPAGLPKTPYHQEKQALKDAVVVGKKELGGGANASHIITLADGGKAVFKPRAGEAAGLRGSVNGRYYAREAAASDVAELVGMHDMVPATVIKRVDGKVGSAQKFASGATDACLFKLKEALDGNKDVARAAAYDHLIGNLDRSHGNWMLKEGKMILIDNGLSFPNRTASVKDQPIQNEAKKRGLEIPKEIKDLDPAVLKKVMLHHKFSDDEIASAKGRLADLKASNNFSELEAAHKERYRKEIGGK